MGAFDDPIIKRAKVAIAKRLLFVPREKRFIQHETVQKIVALGKREQEVQVTAMWVLMAYTFLLRVPSECLPVVVGDGTVVEGPAMATQAVVHVSSDQLTLCLQRRKNKLLGGRYVRSCWCSKSSSTCPVHVLGPFFQSVSVGEAPFAHLTPAKALANLRRALCSVGVRDCVHYRSHDLRRGHAQDMAASGHSLAEILRAGDWSSAAFKAYLDLGYLEAAAIAATHAGESSEDEF